MKKVKLLMLSIATVLLFVMADCGETVNRDVADSGVEKAHAKVKTGPDGLSEEQRNVKEYLEYSNTPGAVKHLYVISAFSGDVLIYSTVYGKVTSSGKRLTSNMTLVHGDRGDAGGDFVMGRIGDDGTYGGSGSSSYIYWKDTQGNFHKHFVTGGQILHVSEVPLVVPKVIINMNEGE